jgi:uncharacterized membrane protein YdjX (TVP38/TMEM64 family)
MLAIIAFGWFALSQTDLGENIRNNTWVKTQIQDLGLYGPLLFILLSGMGTVMGVPRLLVSAISGFVFDLFPAVLIALTSTMVGCVISFYYARFMGRSIIQGLLSLRMKNFESLLIEHDFLASIGVRALPISNNSIVNLLAGVTGVRPLHYFAGSAIGYLPLTIVFVLVGSGIQQDLTGRVLLSLALYLLIVIPLGYVVQKRLRAMSKTNSPQI